MASESRGHATGGRQASIMPHVAVGPVVEHEDPRVAAGSSHGIAKIIHATDRSSVNLHDRVTHLNAHLFRRAFWLDDAAADTPPRPLRTRNPQSPLGERRIVPGRWIS